MDTRLEIYTLGGVRILRRGEPVTGFTTRKAEALLIYLARTHRVQPREVLADLLWDDRTQSQALSNLRGVLSNLHQILGESLLISRDQVELNPASQVMLDAAELERCLQEVRKQGGLNAQTAAQTSEALMLYRGDFLAGFSVYDCSGFDNWQVQERERLHRLAVEGLSSLVEYAIEQKDYSAGIAHVTRLLELDPWMDHAHRQLMLLLSLSGQQAAALSHYESYQKLLRAELKAEPSVETRELCEQIRTGKAGVRVEPSKLPSGTVTFLFTDIEGSTRLLEHLREQYAVVLAEQRKLLRAEFQHWHGYEVDTQGDSFFVAFGKATDAISCAVQIQQALAQHAWPHGVSVRIRMGLHTGEPSSGEESYVGMDVHRAARIAHVGHGGQVLLSETTTALVRDELPPGVSLCDLGRHLLKDIHRPEHISQLVIEGLSSEFPQLTSIAALPSEGERLRRQVGKCPYQGLSAFQEADAQFYFGREKFIDALEQTIHTKKLVAVIVGSSGSGKSSALFAGLLPRLRRAGDYQFASFRPGSQPFYALAKALMPLLEPGLSETDRLAETRNLADRLAKGEVSLSQVAERILEKTTGVRQLLLIIDQFEELYTLCPDEKLQKVFIDELLGTVEASRRQQKGLAVILLTLRADFMGQALGYRPFADALQEASLLMGPMTRAELHRAIEKPAEIQGAAFEAGLVERILDDVGEKAGNLPLLEFTLTQLWERQTDGWLNHADYEAMGCVEGALAAYADRVYAELEPGEQELARRALEQLVQPGEGTEDTRRIATREELGEESWRLIQRLADKRLVVAGRDAQGRETAEVVHEALIQKWGCFQEWMNVDRTFRAWQERLRSSLRQWQESGQDEGALLAGAPLAVAQSWLKERRDYISQPEYQYIESSLGLQVKRRQERQRRRQLTFAGMAVGLVIALLLAAFALYQRQNAQRQAAILLAGQAESELANGYHDRAVLLALAALENYPYTPQAEHALGQAVSYSRALQVYSALTSPATSVAWSPDGKRVAISGSVDNRVDIWDPVTGQIIRSIDMPKGITGNQQDMALYVQWTPDGKRLLTLNGDRFYFASQSYNLLVWDADTGKQISLVTLPNEAPALSTIYVNMGYIMTGAAAEIAPKSGRLATLGGDNTATIWDAGWQSPALVLKGHTQGVNSVDWSTDEKRLVTASLDGTAIIWDALTGQKLHVLTDTETSDAGWANLALWSPDGSQVATASEDGNIRLWDAANGKLLSRIQTNAGGVSSLAWAPNGMRITSGQKDGSIRIWEAASGKLLETLRGHQGAVTDLKWSPVDDRLASTDLHGNVYFWNAAPSTAWRLYPPQAARGGNWYVAGADFSHDSRYLAVAGGDFVGHTEPPSFAIWDLQENRLTRESLAKALNLNGIRLYFSPDEQKLLYVGLQELSSLTGWTNAYVFDARTEQIVRTFTPDGKTIVIGVDWSPDGNLVATGLTNNHFIIWDYQTGKPIVNLVHGSDESKTVCCIEWSPDGSKIATSSDDSTAKVWDTHTWKLLFTVQHEPPVVISTAAWSTDGKRLLTSASSQAWGGKDITAKIWDAATGKLLLVFSNHTGLGITDGVWSPDGRRIATFGSDGTARVWDSYTGDELLTLHVPVNLVLYGRWSPDGQHLAIFGNDTLVSVWRVWQSTQELINYAKQNSVFRQLTDAEKKQFGLP